jgi:hypothetical protein
MKDYSSGSDVRCDEKPVLFLFVIDVYSSSRK